MQLCHAKDLELWLSTVLAEHGHLVQSRVCVVSLVGKSSVCSSSVKSDLVNELLDAHVFLGATQRRYDQPKIEAYLDTSEMVVYLHYVGYGDASLALAMLQHDAQMDVDEVMDEWRMVQAQHWLFLTLVSHIIVVVEPAARFDVRYTRFLRQINLLRDRSSDRICSLLSSIPSVSRDWCRHGRFASARILFAFQRCPIRTDLGNVKRRELITKMARCLESQIYSLFRKSRVVTNQCHQSIVAIPINEPFVWMFDSALQRRDPQSDMLQLLQMPVKSEPWVDNATLDDDNELPPTNYVDAGFPGFIRLHINAAHSAAGFDDNSGKNTPSAYFELPTLKALVEAMPVLYEEIVTRSEEFRALTKCAALLNCEKELDDYRVRRLVPAAMGVYKQELPVYYARATHKIKLSQAEQYLALNIRGTACERAIQQLQQQAHKYWHDQHQACESLSLTGTNCAQPVHLLLDDKSSSSLPRLEHNSNARYMSTCNCGMKQAIRADPFDLKEANFDFYTSSEFDECCGKLERYEFEVFRASKKGSSPSVAPVVNTAAQVEQTLTDSVYFAVGSRTVNNEGDDDDSQDDEVLPMDNLLERNNRLVGNVMGSQQPTVHDSISDDEPDEYKHTVSDISDTQFEDNESNVSETMEDLSEQQELGHSSDDPDSDDDEVEEAINRDDLPNKSPKVGRRPMRRPVSKATGKKAVQSLVDSQYEQHSSQTSSVLGIPNDGAGQLLTSEDTQPATVLSIDTESSSGGNLDELLNDNNVTTEVNKHSVSHAYPSSATVAESLLEHQGEFLAYVPCNVAGADLLPAFPSWSLVCVGHSSNYTHVHGLRDQPNWTHGSGYLLPWHVHLTTDVTKWERKMDVLHSASGRASLQSLSRQRRSLSRHTDDGKVTVKLFIGFEYECPRGHRFTLYKSSAILKHATGGSGPKEPAPVDQDLPLWMACACRLTPQVNAQLMRIHIVTPKAPVAVTINPRVQPDINTGTYFHPGTNGLLQLSYARYYIMRLPYAYVGPNGPFHPPKTPSSSGVGRLMRNMFNVIEVNVE